MFVVQANHMKNVVFRNGHLVNRGQILNADLFVADGRIQRIGSELKVPTGTEEINLDGKYLLPGIIDDQVHFREPGLTHKGRIYTESRAAIAGGVTSYMEMPNTSPPALTQTLLEQKYAIAAQDSPANYSFFMGTSNDNLEEVLATDPKTVCGVKIFMGSSTGNMLVDDLRVLEDLFSRCPMLIATHCEDESTIRHNLQSYVSQYGDLIPFETHPLIRSREACYLSSSTAIHLAKSHGTRLHILHISTADETLLFDNNLPLGKKQITAEACVHHLHFCDEDYARLGAMIKCNPAIKSYADREAIWKAVLDDRIDIIATDHAPHTFEEKQANYLKAPSGLPLVQHALPLMLLQVKQGRFSLERLVEKMCHAPAICFNIQERGFLDEGYWADLVVLDLEKSWTVEKENLLYHCQWSPLEGMIMKGKVEQTWVNGNCIFKNDQILSNTPGMRLLFDR
jgi:dihydroorotase